MSSRVVKGLDIDGVMQHVQSVNVLARPLTELNYQQQFLELVTALNSQVRYSSPRLCWMNRARIYCMPLCYGVKA